MVCPGNMFMATLHEGDNDIIIIIIIIIIISYFDHHLHVKYLAILDPKLSGISEDPYCPCPVYKRTNALTNLI